MTTETCQQTIWLPGFKTRPCGRPATTKDFRGLPLCRKCSYDQYMKSSHWEWTRNRAISMAGKRCQRCDEPAGRGKNGGPIGLNVHHLSYERLGNERSEDLIVLCRSCHAKEHGRPE
jgi:5-methylcytosine-specific restriction endonuclease McrA